MAQQPGHRHEILARIQDGLADAAAQRAGRDPLEAGQPGVLADQQLDRPRAEAIAALPEEQPVARELAGRTAR